MVDQPCLKIFDKCIIAGDSYEDALSIVGYKNESVLLIYTGLNNEACEKYVYECCELNDDLTLSTFQEPYSFFHAELAKMIFIHKNSLTVEIIEQIREELDAISFPLSNIKTI